MKLTTLEVPLFPLKTVLFPGGRLPLKIFEQRYLDMTRDCLRDGQPFGVFLIREGEETSAAALCEEVGCLASITEWDMPQLGIFHLLAEGRTKARILEQRIEANSLRRGKVALIDAEQSISVAPKFQRCAEILRIIITQTGEHYFPQPARYEDGLWVGYRLAEILPMELLERQKLLELQDAEERLEVLSEVLKQQGFHI
ncbi:MAG TPA: LON peptidase substrate-binding domain-containing protein [Burkholderiales bacterium]|nr:LON peptidase substrate-binding domain-containing protein [Burkholderiales bacterium]